MKEYTWFRILSRHNVHKYNFVSFLTFTLLKNDNSTVRLQSYFNKVEILRNSSKSIVGILFSKHTNVTIQKRVTNSDLIVFKIANWRQYQSYSNKTWCFLRKGLVKQRPLKYLALWEAQWLAQTLLTQAFSARSQYLIRCKVVWGYHIGQMISSGLCDSSRRKTYIRQISSKVHLGLCLLLLSTFNKDSYYSSH